MVSSCDTFQINGGRWECFILKTGKIKNNTPKVFSSIRLQRWLRWIAWTTGHSVLSTSVMWVSSYHHSFDQQKLAGPDGIFQHFYKDFYSHSSWLVIIFRNSRELGYIPNKWREVLPPSIPKTGEMENNTQKVYRSISLSFFTEYNGKTGGCLFKEHSYTRHNTLIKKLCR